MWYVNVDLTRYKMFIYIFCEYLMRDWLWAASEAPRSSHELPEDNLTFARKCSDIVATIFILMDLMSYQVYVCKLCKYKSVFAGDLRSGNRLSILLQVFGQQGVCLLVKW